MSDRQRFFELLPFHVNETISAKDAAWMECELARHPELRSQLAFMQSMRAAVREKAEIALADVPADIGFAALSARMASRRTGLRAVLGRLRAGLDAAAGLLAPGRLVPLASGLVLGLGIGVGMMLVLPESTPWSESRGAAPGLADGPLLRVTFRPETRESELRLALLDARVLVVAGPTRLGDYYLKAAPGHIGGARASLQKSGLVLQIEEVPELAPELTE